MWGETRDMLGGWNAASRILNASSISNRAEDSRLSWLHKLVIAAIVAAWVFWAAGWHPHFDFPTDAEFDAEKQAVEEMDAFQRPIMDKAYALGKKYTPQECVADLKKIALKDRELGHPRRLEVGNGQYNDVADISKTAIHRLVEEGWQFDPDRKNAFSGPLYELQEWQLKNCPEPGAEWLSKTLKNATWSGIWGWVWVFYLRSLLLVLPLYLLRMMRRKGVLATILADKRAFLLYWLVWPVGLFKYPYNVVREIRVEAELRRLGEAFRRFTSDEKEFVRAIANSASYRGWLKSYQSQNRGRFQRNLVLAMMATIILWLGCPLTMTKSSAATGHKSRMTVCAVAKAAPIETSAFLTQAKTVNTDSSDEGSSDDDGGGMADLPAMLVVERPILLAKTPRLIGLKVPISEPRVQEHVPLSGCLFDASKLIQTVGVNLRPFKEEKNAEHHRLYGTFGSNRAAHIFNVSICS